MGIFRFFVSLFVEVSIYGGMRSFTYLCRAIFVFIFGFGGTCRTNSGLVRLSHGYL